MFRIQQNESKLK